MLAKLYGAALLGVNAFGVQVEVSVTRGLGYQITGLADEGIKESLSRIAIAVQQSGYEMPRTKLLINLAPADTRKTGTAFDLPIALGILLATGQIKDGGRLQDYIIAGELGLDGSVAAVRGALCMADLGRREGCKGLILPGANAREAAMVQGIPVYGVRHLKEVIGLVSGDLLLKPAVERLSEFKPTPDLDFRDVKGQQRVKRALEIAAAGGHNALVIGPPGTGKTMLAKRIPSILPPMTLAESLETTRIHSVVNQFEPLSGLIRERPFRSPHHTTSDVALVGGGSVPVPGEISLAHNGVLFLDELPEFKRSTIETLRQPLEDRKVLIARAKCSLEYPASFMLLAAMNPCLCGWLGHPTRRCSCSKRAIYWYRRRISSPLLERIDLHIEAESVPLSELLQQREPAESSAVIRARVIRAREIQSNRFKDSDQVYCNAQMPDRDLERFCALDPSTKRFLIRQMDRLQLSVRSYARVLKIARTIADLAGRNYIDLPDIAEAISLRSLDKPLNISSGKKPTNAIGSVSIPAIHSIHPNGQP